ncbi:ankyrin repeat domain-containing protein 31-like [Centropristis striata]|uniref:ankyrin repeat domain-containing protein 31-like n=1 Tax=Centropristis striata TaxID=184440 RepID=UPI0027DFD13C|nr:ankyrin repeat domain-containing protein 31-like [Centropristis striata]
MEVKDQVQYIQHKYISFLFLTTRNVLKMTDSCSKEHDSERNGYVSTSDDDSISLLCDVNAWQSRGAAEDMEISDLDSQFGNKEQKKKVEPEINRFKPPEPGISSCMQSTAGPADSTSPSAAKVSKSVRITNKTNVNKRDGKGETLLHKACKKVDLARVKMLIQAGVSINMEDNAGWTALHEACVVGDEAVVEELLKAGANVNARSSDGVTPLHDAVSAGHYQVVKLLLQCGSNASDRTVGGLSAVDMAEEENIKELLSVKESTVTHEQPCGAPAQCRQPGDTSSEAHCHKQLSLQSSSSPSRSDTANVRPRESDDRDGAREPGDIQLGKKDTTTDNLTHSDSLTVALEEVRRKQAQISTWPLTGPEDAGRYHAAVTEIQNVLIEVLNKQQLKKNNLDQKYRNVSESLRQSVLKSQLENLASCQKNLVEVFQKQMNLVEVYVTMKAKLSTQPSNHQCNILVTQQPDLLCTPAPKAREEHSCNQNTPRKENQRQVTQTRPLKSTSSNHAKDLRVPGPPAPLLTEALKTCQSSTQQPHISIQMKGNNALIERRAQDNGPHLSQLIQRGVVPSGSDLKLLLKGHWHFARVLGDGSIKDRKRKCHLAPERWLESILGNNIPVSSMYAWDKVTFRDKPLSYYLLNMEAEGHKPQTCPEDDPQHCSTASSQEELTTEAASLRRLMEIKIIHLVADEELLPNALMDCYWEKLLKSDEDSEDWGAGFL